MTTEDFVTYQPYDGLDTYIRSSMSQAGDMGQDSEWLHVGGWGDQYYTFLQFNLTGLPTDVDSVVLRLYEAIGEHDVWTYPDMSLWTVNGDWQEGMQWYQNTTQATFVRNIESPDSGPGWFEIDITDIYRQWQSGELANDGIQLRPLTTYANQVYFVSSESADAEHRPMLLIDPADAATQPLVFQQPLGPVGTAAFTEDRTDGDGWGVTRDFNDEVRSTLRGHGGDTHNHLGEDWAPTRGPVIGAEIYSVASGTVVFADWHDVFGNVVIVQHDVSGNDGLAVDTVYSLYAHLDSIDLEDGQLEAGELIGTLGGTGSGARGPHLHLEIFSADWQAYINGEYDGLLGYAEAPQPTDMAAITDGWYDPSDFIVAFMGVVDA